MPEDFASLGSTIAVYSPGHKLIKFATILMRIGLEGNNP
jgi:hypothetical protein